MIHSRQAEILSTRGKRLLRKVSLRSPKFRKELVETHFYLYRFIFYLSEGFSRIFAEVLADCSCSFLNIERSNCFSSFIKYVAQRFAKVISAKLRDSRRGFCHRHPYGSDTALNRLYITQKQIPYHQTRHH